MENAYPAPRNILRTVLLALFVAQFIVWPLVGLLDPHLGIAATELSIVGFMALYLRRNRLLVEDALLLNAAPRSTLIAVVPTALAGGLLVAEFDLYVNDLLRSIDWSAPISLQRNALQIQIIGDFWQIPKVVAAVAFLPAACEELFFRGLVFTSLYAHGGPKRALLLSAFLFAAAHFNPWQLPALFALGLLLAALTYWSHSIYPAMLAHCLNNALSIAGVNARAHWGIDALSISTHMPIAILIFSALVFCGGLYVVSRSTPIMPLPTRSR